MSSGICGCVVGGSYFNLLFWSLRHTFVDCIFKSGNWIWRSFALIVGKSPSYCLLMKPMDLLNKSFKDYVRQMKWPSFGHWWTGGMSSSQNNWVSGQCDLYTCCYRLLRWELILPWNKDLYPVDQQPLNSKLLEAKKTKIKRAGCFKPQFIKAEWRFMRLRAPREMRVVEIRDPDCERSLFLLTLCSHTHLAKYRCLKTRHTSCSS